MRVETWNSSGVIVLMSLMMSEGIVLYAYKPVSEGSEQKAWNHDYSHIGQTDNREESDGKDSIEYHSSSI